MPVSSLPSPYGIGCFSQEAYDFVDWLKEAGQTYWQILPLGVTSYGDSPYQSFSAFAGTHQHAQHHADADRLDDLHDVAHDLAGAELLEERRRQKRQRQGGAEDAQDREDAARHPGGLGACKGGGVDAQRAGGHLGDGDEGGGAVKRRTGK